MDNRFTRALYDRSPIFAKSIASSALGWIKNRRRYRGDFAEWSALFRESPGWSEAELYDYQARRLRELVADAARFVPYYSEAFARAGIRPEEIREPSDLEKLPILEKSDIVRAGETLLDSRVQRARLQRYPTSGSTGTPLIVPRSDTIEQMEWAFHRERWWPKDAVGQPYASFSGLELLPASRTHAPFWVDNWASAQRMYSIFHMSDENLPRYIESFERRYNHSFVGYPSAIFLVCDFLERRGLALDRPPRYCLTSSEELQPRYEEAIRNALGADIRNRYGQNEFVGSITTYECGHLHYDMDYSILEFLPVSQEDDGEVVAEIIGTNMHDRTWPLLRYRTGDLVTYHPEDRCQAGRPGLVIRRIHGRSGRYFELPNGSRVTNISVIAKKCTNVKLMQVIQFEPGSILVRVVRDTGFGEVDAERIVREFQRKVGVELGIELDYVDDIERTASGKFISIINRIDPPEPTVGD